MSDVGVLMVALTISVGYLWWSFIRRMKIADIRYEAIQFEITKLHKILADVKPDDENVSWRQSLNMRFKDLQREHMLLKDQLNIVPAVEKRTAYLTAQVDILQQAVEKHQIPTEGITPRGQVVRSIMY